jgi:hypothetical protein
VEKNDLGFDLSLLFIGYGDEWGPNGPQWLTKDFGEN